MVLQVDSCLWILGLVQMIFHVFQPHWGDFESRVSGSAPEGRLLEYPGT